MCLIAFAWGADERFPFVVAANRDEFLTRPTVPLSQWISPGGACVLAGRDLRDGGTWMGFSPNGRFAMLTNVRDPKATPPEHAISRGSLPLAWLESQLQVHAWSQSIEPHRYAGFNLLVGDWTSKQCHYLSNQYISKAFEHIAGIKYEAFAIKLVANEVPWGECYGLSNAALNTPWPKTQFVKTALSESLTCENAEQLTRRNLQALSQSIKPEDSELPSTGVLLELERALSSPFVSHPQAQPNYGTRTSLVAVFQAGMGLSVTEVTHSHQGSHPLRLHQRLDWR